MTKKFHMLTHLSQALVLEEELFEDQDLEYAEEFSKDFLKEQMFLSEMKMTKQDPAVTDNSSPKNSFLHEEKLKELHRKLVVKTHPDKEGGKEEEFLKIQQAYEEKDAAALISAASKFKIDFELSDNDLDNITHDIESRKNKLHHRKNTLRWTWCTGDKGAEAKKVIRSAMQIDERIFQKWSDKAD